MRFIFAFVILTVAALNLNTASADCGPNGCRAPVSRAVSALNHARPVRRAAAAVGNRCSGGQCARPRFVQRVFGRLRGR